jgi:hypothetical protein
LLNHQQTLPKLNIGNATHANLASQLHVAPMIVKLLKVKFSQAAQGLKIQHCQWYICQVGKSDSSCGLPQWFSNFFTSCPMPKNSFFFLLQSFWPPKIKNHHTKFEMTMRKVQVSIVAVEF